MPKYVQGRKSITVRFTDKEYDQLKTLSSKNHKSMSEIAREYTVKGLCGAVTEDNIDFLAPIIREQLQSVLDPKMERMIALQAKTCMQASVAAYLSADAILKFVPPSQRVEVKESYEAAQKKAIIYIKSKTDMNENE